MHWFAAQPLGVHVFSPYRAVIKPPLEVVVMTFFNFFRQPSSANGKEEFESIAEIAINT